MNALETTISTDRPGSTVGSPATRYTPGKAADAVVGLDDITGLFEAVLQASQQISTGLVAGIEGRVSPALMFEAADTGGQDHGTSAPDTRAGGEPLDRLGAEQFDRTSVAARKAASQNRTDGSSGDGGLDISHRSTVQSGNNATLGMATDSGGSPSLQDSDTGVRSQLFATADPSAESLSFANTVGPGNATLPLPGQGIAGFAATTRAISVVSSVGATKGSVTHNSAAFVGQLLAGGHAGDAEALRPGSAGGESPAATTMEARSANVSRASNQGSADASNALHRNGAASGEAHRAESSTFNQLIRSIRLNAAGQHSSARLLLDPPELGRMDIEIRVTGKRMSIDVRTETDAARRLVQHRVADLVAALEEHGISVERIEISAHAFTENFTEIGDPGSGTGAETPAPKQQSSLVHSDSAVSEDAASGLMESEEELELAAVAETRLDIRV